MKKLKLIFLLIGVFTTFLAFSQSENYFSAFEGRHFYKPFISEISSTLSHVDVGVATDIKKKDSPVDKVFTEVHLGADIPLLYQERGKMKWALSLPVSFHMLWNTFEETTAPIINNDYRFGLSFTGISYFQNSFIKNISYKITPLAHESTHLGDEISIYGIQNIDNFYRVNVSYEYYELGLTINDPDTLTSNLLSVRLGFMGLLNPENDYYTISENEVNDKVIYPTERWAEYYININYTKTSGFLTSKNWHPSFSVELRNRVYYQYEREGKNDRGWGINAFIGYEYVPKRAKGIKSVGHYFRYYNGINPHGQLRNRDYTFYGYSIVLFY